MQLSGFATGAVHGVAYVIGGLNVLMAWTFQYLFPSLVALFGQRGVPLLPVKDIERDVLTAASQAERECAKFINNQLSRHCDAPAVQADKLDYSLDSLSYVDEWLIQILTHYSGDVERQAIEDLTCFGIRDGQALIKGVGVYCGEVIRRTQSDKWRWRTYAGFLIDPNFADEVKATRMSLSDPLKDLVLIGSRVCIRLFPADKVAKFTVNGPEDSLYVYAFHAMQTMAKL